MVFYPQFCTYHAIQYLLFSGISVVFILSVRCWNNKYLFIYLFKTGFKFPYTKQLGSKRLDIPYNKQLESKLV